MSHPNTPPEARPGGRRPLTAVRALVARLERHVAEWPRRYVEMRVGPLDADE